MNTVLDARDQEILGARILARDTFDRPRLGDYVRFPTGEVERLSHDWGDGFQTSPSGSFYLSGNGRCSFSGGLNPITPLNKFRLTGHVIPGSFWFFHHDQPGAGRGVHCTLPCRVYETSASFDGYLGSSWRSEEISKAKKILEPAVLA